MGTPEDTRLNRIEEKIDKLAETVIQMARAEEKIVNIEKAIIAINTHLDNVADRTGAIEKRIEENSASLLIINRVFWISLSTIITTLLGAALIKL